MTNKWEEGFRDIAAEFYPGSSRERHVNRVQRPESDKDGTEWDRSPRLLTIPGKGEQEFFTIGALAEALGRRPPTLRAWEREGILPRASYRLPSPDPRGVRRLYSRAQVEGIVAIAYEEGLMNPNVQVTLAKTAFTSKVLALFKELRG